VSSRSFTLRGLGPELDMEISGRDPSGSTQVVRSLRRRVAVSPCRQVASDPHGDYNPWDGWNSEWKNKFPSDPRLPGAAARACTGPGARGDADPWWRQIPDWFPEPLPVSINPCFFMPWFCGIGSGSVDG
jgi:hypothetical protein